ncbi:HupE/UreJ family protein [Marinobacterium rhizophilum]|uniref:HupE/UreJ family protein n=1 Tax=Marinobacterium rhizophilum TaxID=420402 RepID=A0ABY5HNG0_9GAMM|nr:HupE/UreJ family protein [Marinobacterium rhizophilum]UTW12740.1 HupE/UreJ family protein [Marinobacterium rhizophilum]
MSQPRTPAPAAQERKTFAPLLSSLSILLLLICAPAQAHFQNFLGRILHVEAQDGGTLIHARLPLASVLLPRDWDPLHPLHGVPYARANPVASGPDGLLLDTASLQANPQQLHARLAAALQLVGASQPDGSPAVPPVAAPEIRAIRIQPIQDRSPFSHLSQVRTELTRPLDLGQAPPALTDAVIDFRIFYRQPLQQLAQIRSNPAEWPDIAARSINILTLHQDGERTRLTSSGVLAQPLQASSPWQLRDSLGSGFYHVLIGLDHVLFMLILILAARHWRVFVHNSLAFTLGHSVTLALGAAGLITGAAWFIPLIETAIALSILYSGACLLLGAQQRLLAGRVFLIGLLHGLGFAFMLAQASGQNAGDTLLLWFGFNLGVELAQLSIYGLALPLLWLLGRYWPPQRLAFRTLLATPCVLAALLWSGQRSLDLIDAMGWQLS